MYGGEKPITISVKLQKADIELLDTLRPIVSERPDLVGNIDPRMSWQRGYGEASRSEVLRACLRKQSEDLAKGKTVPKKKATSKRKTAKGRKSG